MFACQSRIELILIIQKHPVSVHITVDCAALLVDTRCLILISYLIWSLNFRVLQLWLKTISLVSLFTQPRDLWFLRRKKLFTLWECLTFYHLFWVWWEGGLNETHVIY